MKTIRNIVLASALSAMFVGCAGDRYHRSTGSYIDDKSTAAKVKTDLYADPMVKGTQVRVQVYAGKVQLAGFVDTQQQKDRAADIARRIQGVQWVKNDLIVKTQLPQGSWNRNAPIQGGAYIQEPAGSGAQVQGSVKTNP